MNSNLIGHEGFIMQLSCLEDGNEIFYVCSDVPIWQVTFDYVVVDTEDRINQAILSQKCPIYVIAHRNNYLTDTGHNL